MYALSDTSLCVLSDISCVLSTISLCVSGLFANSNLSFAQKFYLEKYRLEVTPSDWTFYMTALIYFWQSLWLTYGVSQICRRVNNGYFYTMFPILPPDLYVVFSFSLACNVSWLLIWDKQYMEVALVFVNLMSCTLYICLVVSLRRLNEYGALMVMHNMNRDIWMVRILVQNGLGMFAAWGTVAAMFNFAVVLCFGTGTKSEVASTVSLSIFMLEIFAWWIFDNFVFDKYLRYLFTPYIVILLSIAGIISKNWDPTKTNALFTVLIFGLVFLMTVIKLALVIWRHKRRPIFTVSPRYRQPVVSFESRTLLDT